MAEIQVDDALVFPEDLGTGIQEEDEADFNSAGLLALLAEKNKGSYIASGIDIQPDYTTNTVTLTSGYGFYENSYPDIDAETPSFPLEEGPPVQTDGEEAYNAQLPEPTSLAFVLQSNVSVSLEADTVNEVYLRFNRLNTGSNDDVSLVAGGSVEPSQAQEELYYHLATIDTSTGLVEERVSRGGYEALEEIRGHVTNGQSVTNMAGTGLTVEDGELQTQSRYDEKTFEADETDSVANADYDVLTTRMLSPNESVRVDFAEAAVPEDFKIPVGMTLRLVYVTVNTTDGSTQVTDYRTILKNPDEGFPGEGFTPNSRQVQYTNLSQAPQKAVIVVDNGGFGSGTGSAKDYVASVGGIIQEDTNEVMIDISPSGGSYVNHTGAVFTAQSDTNVGFYEIQSETDAIEFNIPEVSDLENPTLVINTVFGPTGFTLEDRSDGSTITSDVSGFDSDVWMVDLSETSGEYRLTSFTDTQAAFYPSVRLYNEQ